MPGPDAANRSVIGVVGAHNSACATSELPILNAAASGSVRMVSPTKSDINLTHEYKDIPGGTGGLYPTGVRSCARVSGQRSPGGGAGDAAQAPRPAPG